MNRGSTITLSLISHTNVGKTTLARTLLRRDVGQVLDQPHVTDISEAHPLLETGDATLLLWDTPGFGDTGRLLKRLHLSGNPVGWLLTQVWDRFADRPLWCSQQAVRNVQDEAEVVLYLVNAAEEPKDAGYVDMEMQILTWIDVPVIVLLNQTGPPREPSREQTEQRLWQEHLRAYPVIRRTLTLDAFARCWVQERILLDTIDEILPEERQQLFGSLARAWHNQNLSIFNRSMAVLAYQLAHACVDKQIMEKQSITEKLRRLLALNQDALSGKETAMAALAERLDHQIRTALDELIRLHGLEGQAASKILRRLQDDYAASIPLNEGLSVILGGFVTGALGGLVADLAAGGLTFGGGALVGGILGAAGAGGLAKGYNLVRGESSPTLRWGGEFFEGLVRSALLRYLAVAHYGRGRGNFEEGEHPKFWQQEVATRVTLHRQRIMDLWEQGKSTAEPRHIAMQLEPVVSVCARDILVALYPEAKSIFKFGE